MKTDIDKQESSLNRIAIIWRLLYVEFSQIQLSDGAGLQETQAAGGCLHLLPVPERHRGRAVLGPGEDDPGVVHRVRPVADRCPEPGQEASGMLTSKTFIQ